MQTIASFFQQSGFSLPDLMPYAQRLQTQIQHIDQERRLGYATPFASLHAPYDDQLIQQVRDKAVLLQADLLIVIGIGGSALGFQAVWSALAPSSRVHLLDTIDADKIAQLYDLLAAVAEKKGSVTVVVISKSGDTVETAMNLQLCVQVVADARVHAHWLAITHQHSPLWQIAQELSWHTLPVPAHIGGRYAVFSPVGLFPLAWCGIDIIQLLGGARSMIESAFQLPWQEHGAALRALTLYAHYRAGKNIHDLFLFAPRLAAVGAWYRQLVGESLGKMGMIDGVAQPVGIVPTVSLGTVDLHSVAQLYLGGPVYHTTTFVLVKEEQAYRVPHLSPFEKLVPHLQGKTTSALMHAVATGVQRAYENQARPFMVVELSRVSAWYLGQLMQMMMLEIMYTGYMLGVDPFDQPQVELYKQETRKMLADE